VQNGNIFFRIFPACFHDMKHKQAKESFRAIFLKKPDFSEKSGFFTQFMPE